MNIRPCLFLGYHESRHDELPMIRGLTFNNNHMKVKNYDDKYAITKTSMHTVYSNNVSIIGAYAPMLDNLRILDGKYYFQHLVYLATVVTEVIPITILYFLSILVIWLWKILYNIHPFLGSKCFQGFSSHISIRTNFEH